MAQLDKEIGELKSRVVKYETELDAATSAQEKSEVRQIIQSTNETLNILLDEKKHSLPRESNRPLGILWSDEKFDFFGHGIDLAVGVLGIGSLVAGCGLYAVKHHHRAMDKFFQSLSDRSKNKLKRIKFSVLPRGDMYVGIGKEPIKRLDLHSASKSVALKGDNQCGKTIFLSSTVLNEMFPWWYRYFFPPRGLFLTGSKSPATVDAWLKNQIATTEKEDPWSAVADLLNQRSKEQRIRMFLLTVFKTKLPVFLQPQPAIIVVDQAEELLRAFRAEFLVRIYDLVKEARDDDHYRLVLIINTENAVKALKLMNGGNMFDVIEAPKVSREAVVEHYGDDFAKIFDDCDGCIGVALDYMADKERPKDQTAKAYAAKKKEMYLSDNCLVDEITKEEYIRAGYRVKK